MRKPIPLCIASAAVIVVSTLVHAAEPVIVRSNLPSSATNALPDESSGALTGSFASNFGQYFGRVSVSADGSRFVVPGITNRNDDTSSSAFDNLIFTGTGTGTLQTISRTGAASPYNPNAAIEYDVSVTNAALLQASIDDAGNAAYRAFGEIVSGTNRRDLLVYRTDAGTRTLVASEGGSAPVIGATARTFTTPTTPAAYNGGFYFVSTLSGSRQGLFNYNASTNTVSAVMESLESTVVNPIQGSNTNTIRSFPSANTTLQSLSTNADGSRWLTVSQVSGTTNDIGLVDTGTVILNNNYAIPDPNPLTPENENGDRIISREGNAAALQGLMGSTGTVIAAGLFTQEASELGRPSWLAKTNSDGKFEVLARSGDAVPGGLAGERYAGPIRNSTTLTNGARFSSLALDDQDNFAFTAVGTVESPTDPLGTAIPTSERDLLIYNNSSILLAEGDAVPVDIDLDANPATQDYYYVAGFVGYTLSINSEYAYIVATLRDNPQLTGTTYGAMLAIPIPEPTSLAVAGLVAAGVLRRRR